MANLSLQIFEYIEHLEKQYKLWISIHFAPEYRFLRSSAAFADIYAVYNAHKNPYCMNVKRMFAIEKCFSHQQDILTQCTDKDSFLCTCHASVTEYIRPFFYQDKVAGYICVSGYCTSPAKEKDRLAMQKSMLYQENPPSELLDTLTYPLAFMMTSLIEENCSNIYEGHNQHYMAILLYLNEKHIDVSLSEISEKLNLSKSYISHLFKKYNGNTLKGYCNLLCLTDAKNLLRTTSLSISEISYTVGFDNVSYFISLFKKHTGMTPFLWRKQHHA